MKIGFLGNANNYPFMLARAIREAGHDVLFVLMLGPSLRLDRPENQYVDLTPPYPDWIHDAGHVELWNASLCCPHQRRVIELLQGCDAVVLNQYGLCLAAQIGKPTVALLTGTDLLTLSNRSYATEAVAADGSANHAYLPVRKLMRNFYVQRIEAQRFAIESSVMANYMPMGMTPAGDDILAELGVSGSRRTCFFMTDTQTIQAAPPPNNHPVRVFCATRFTWDRTTPPFYTDLDYKGSDVMIRGLGQFVRKGTPLDIHLVRKGEHLEQTVKLIESEGLGGCVVWHDEMTQTEIWQQYKQADIVLDQFDSSAVGMAGWDAMATGRPVIAHGRPEAVAPAHGIPLPVCQATTPEQICDQLERLVPDREERLRVGASARQCMEQHFSAAHAGRIVLEHLEQFRRDVTAQRRYKRQLKRFRQRGRAFQRRQQCLLEQFHIEQLLGWRQKEFTKPRLVFNYLKLNSHYLRIQGSSLVRSIVTPTKCQPQMF